MLKNLNPNYALIYSTILWGTWWYPLRLLNEYAENNAIPLFLSFILVGIIILFISFKKISSFSKKNILFTLIAAFAGGAAMCLYNEGLFRGNVARVLIFFYLTSVWSTLIEVYFLNKPLTIFRGFSIAAGFTGLFIMTGLDQGNFLPNSFADLFAILAGILWSVAATFLRINKDLDINFTTSLCILIGGICVIAATYLPSGQVLSGFDFEILSNTFLIIIIFAFIWILPAYWLTCMGSDQVDPGRAGIFMMFEVVIGVFSAFLLANEIITTREFLGAILILTAPLVELYASKKSN